MCLLTAEVHFVSPWRIIACQTQLNIYQSWLSFCNWVISFHRIRSPGSCLMLTLQIQTLLLWWECWTKPTTFPIVKLHIRTDLLHFNICANRAFTRALHAMGSQNVCSENLKVIYLGIKCCLSNSQPGSLRLKNWMNFTLFIYFIFYLCNRH